MVAVEAHGAAQLHGVLGQRHLEEGDVAAGDYLQHPGPVAVVGRIHVCGTERVGVGGGVNSGHNTHTLPLQLLLQKNFIFKTASAWAEAQTAAGSLRFQLWKWSSSIMPNSDTQCFELVFRDKESGCTREVKM